MERAELRTTITECLKYFSPKANDSITDETSLFSADGLLDSIGLVSFIIELELQLLEKHGLAVQFVTDKTLSEKNSPFRSIGSLIDFVAEIK